MEDETRGDLNTEMNVPGRKNIVTAAIVIMEELSRCASLARVVVAWDIFMLKSLSTCVERWKAWVQILAINIGLGGTDEIDSDIRSISII